MHKENLDSNLSIVDKELQVFENILQSNPNEAHVYNACGYIIYNMASTEKDDDNAVRLYKNAIERFDKSIINNKNYAEAHYNMGLALLKLGILYFKKKDKEKAKGSFERAEKKFEDMLQLSNDASTKEIANAYLFSGITLFALAEIAFDPNIKNGNDTDKKNTVELYKKAMNNCKKASEFDSSNADIYNKWGLVLHNYAIIIEDDDFLIKAIEKFTETIKLDRSNADIYYNFGKAYNVLASRTNDKNSYEQAIAMLKEAIKIDSDCIDAYNEMGFALLKLALLETEPLKQKELTQNSIDVYELGINKELNHDYVFDNLGNAFSQLAVLTKEEKYFIKAKEKYEQALIINKEHVNAMYNLGVTLYSYARYMLENHDEDKALVLFKQTREAYNKVIDLDKENIKVYIYLGTTISCIAKLSANKEIALNLLEEAIKIVKEYKDKMNNLLSELRDDFKHLKNLSKDLEPNILKELLMFLRYLIKDSSFKEEQECRILVIKHLCNDKEFIINENNQKLYIEYLPAVTKHVKKVYFGPKATGQELFEDIAINKNLEISCKKSKHPLF